MTYLRKNMRFSRLNQVACKSPGLVSRTFKTKILKIFSKFFSQLEVLPAKELQGKSRKSLNTLVTGTFTREQVARLSREKY